MKLFSLFSPTHSHRVTPHFRHSHCFTFRHASFSFIVHHECTTCNILCAVLGNKWTFRTIFFASCSLIQITQWLFLWQRREEGGKSMTFFAINDDGRYDEQGKRNGRRRMIRSIVPMFRDGLSHGLGIKVSAHGVPLSPITSFLSILSNLRRIGQCFP